MTKGDILDEGTVGYVIANNGLTDDLVYVGYDTTYITWFNGYEVPIVNSASYSREDGEVNTMIAPVRSMKGDTATIYYGYHDNWTYDDIYGSRTYSVQQGTKDSYEARKLIREIETGDDYEAFNLLQDRRRIVSVNRKILNKWEIKSENTTHSIIGCFFR